MPKKFKPYVTSIIIALAVGGLSALLTMRNMNIYESINTPSVSPPGAAFPIVWAILYTLMGISSAIVYKSDSVYKWPALGIYILNLFVNFLWSIIFFNLRAYLFSFIWLLLLLFIIAVMIYRFFKASPVAAYLQLPYFLWVCFAGYLNFMIFIMN